MKKIIALSFFIILSSFQVMAQSLPPPAMIMEPQNCEGDKVGFGCQAWHFIYHFGKTKSDLNILVAMHPIISLPSMPVASSADEARSLADELAKKMLKLDSP